MSQSDQEHIQPPGTEAEMTPQADHGEASYRGSGKLTGRVAVITGGDSGIGRAVAIAFAREGADILISYLNEQEDADARETARHVEAAGRRCVLVLGDIAEAAHCRAIIERAVNELGRIDILVNNAAFQRTYGSLEDIPDEEWSYTFRTNIEAMFHLTKGAVSNFTAGPAQMLGSKGIRVNAVAPGPIWTPLLPSTMPPEKVKSFGADTPLGRAGQPKELAGIYVLLASEEGSYMTGGIYAVTGGTPLL